MSTTTDDARHDGFDTDALNAVFAEMKPLPQIVEFAPLPRPTRTRMSSASFQVDNASSRDWLRIFFGIVSVIFLSIGLFDLLQSTPTSITSSAVASSPTSPEFRTVTREIQDFDVAQRVAGRNPLRDQVETLPEPQSGTSRKLLLRMQKESGLALKIKLLRSLDWITHVGAIEGGRFYLELPEMGAVGDAFVEAILPCPEIEDGPGNIVTGVFEHEADPDTKILSVTFANGAHIEGVTDNHPFYSVDRKAFIAIGEMREGETVQVNDGTTTITQIKSRLLEPGTMLYNLETHNEHVFQVTLAGVLVHNSCPGVTFHGTDVDSALHLLNGGRLDAAMAAARKIEGSPGFFLATHADDAFFFASRRSGTVLKFELSAAARRQLDAAGILRRPIPQGAKPSPFFGDELFVRPDQFDLFNSLLDSGDIIVAPHKF